MTTTVMMEAVKSGVGREAAHKAIKEHAVATVNDLRSGKVERNNLVERLAGDSRLGLSKETLDAILARGESECGAAKSQVAAFAEAVRKLESAHPQAAAYGPGAIL
ncbi:MAG: adenylosuccinate lyase, partial [Verrucomicrobiae bacterium]|nr:adenylosuccinate lyase [Verrucomicrobiae bacterium]